MQIFLITLYLVLIAIVDGAMLVLLMESNLAPAWLSSRLLFSCCFIGGLGGATYCLRGIYLNVCVRKRWNDEWKPWYYIRPIVSHICGAVSFLFLKAGLILLESKSTDPSTDFGFLTLAFIAGLNVDKFIIKIENIAQATWGIEQSRKATEEEK